MPYNTIITYIAHFMAPPPECIIVMYSVVGSCLSYSVIQRYTSSVFIVGASFLEVVSHYYQYLVEYMDSDSISHVMVCRKLLTGGDMEVINKCSSNRQRNVLLLNRVLHMSATELLAFCEVVQELEHQHYISTILTSGEYIYI